MSDRNRAISVHLFPFHTARRDRDRTVWEGDEQSEWHEDTVHLTASVLFTARVFHPRSLTSFHSLHYVHAPFHSVPNEVRDERPSRVMRTGKEREWTRLTAQHLQSYRSDWWPFPAVSMSSTHLLHLSHVGSYPPFLIPFVSLRYASLLSLHSFRREPTSLWGGDTTEVSVRWEVAERYTSLYARLTYGPSVLCSSRVALRVPLRSRLRRVRWGEIENEWVTRSEGTSERSTHRCALSLTVHPSVTRHSVRPLVPRLLTSFLVPTVWRVEDVRSRGGRTEHRPDENRRNDWDTSPTVPAVYRSLRSLPSLLTSLHSCRSLMLHSLLSFHSWGEGNGTERGVNRTELSGMRGAKGRGKVIRKGYNYIISYLFLIHTISYYYTYHIFTYYRDYHIITLYLLQGLLQGLTLYISL